MIETVNLPAGWFSEKTGEIVQLKASKPDSGYADAKNGTILHFPPRGSPFIQKSYTEQK